MITDWSCGCCEQKFTEEQLEPLEWHVGGRRFELYDLKLCLNCGGLLQAELDAAIARFRAFAQRSVTRRG